MERKLLVRLNVYVYKGPRGNCGPIVKGNKSGELSSGSFIYILDMTLNCKIADCGPSIRWSMRIDLAHPKYPINNGNAPQASPIELVSGEEMACSLPGNRGTTYRICEYRLLQNQRIVKNQGAELVEDEFVEEDLFPASTRILSPAATERLKDYDVAVRSDSITPVVGQRIKSGENRSLTHCAHANTGPCSPLSNRSPRIKLARTGARFGSFAVTYPSH